MRATCVHALYLNQLALEYENPTWCSCMKLGGFGLQGVVQTLSLVPVLLGLNEMTFRCLAFSEPFPPTPLHWPRRAPLPTAHSPTEDIASLLHALAGIQSAGHIL